MAASLGRALAVQTWKKRCSQEKLALCIIFNKTKFKYSCELFQSSKIF